MNDSILTVAVGRRRASDGRLLSERAWHQFVDDLEAILGRHGTIVASVEGVGVGSDGVNAKKSEDSHAYIVANPEKLENLRQKVAKVLQAYDQSSACFSLDLSHEPVFTTEDGYREEN
jgi:hypothetical protein